VAARGLDARKVDHMPEQTSDRRAQDVQDVETAACSVRHLTFTLC
jgi:hypothetical protein